MITITIATDNAAFEPVPEQETARILRILCMELLAHGMTKGDVLPLHDINGNTVGKASIEG